MADGFKANAAFFKLGFLDKNSVALGRQLKELMPVLWMKAGAIGKCPSITRITDTIILRDNAMAVLVNEKAYLQFLDELKATPEVETVFIVTDSERAYREMVSGLDDEIVTYQLYSDYLDNFRINSVRR
jgi:adenine-specific DNA-methyltransferase